MIRNYFKIVLRNMLKQKFFSSINILGMTVGITSSLLILLYIQDELSFDKFHANASRIYQVGLHGKIGGQDIRTANTCPPLAAALVAEVPEVESSTRVIPYYGQNIIRYGNKSFAEERIFYADSNFFSFFSFKLLEGDPKSALQEPNSIVLSERAAARYFEKGMAVGKLITIGSDKKAFKVTGVAENIPNNSHFKFEFLISSVTDPQYRKLVWINNFMYNYFTLRPHANVAGVTEKMERLVEKYVGPEIAKFMGTTLKQLKEQGGAFGYYVTPLTDIHLHSSSRDDIDPGGNILYVYSFGIIAVFIIVIACINFMNMSTARSAGRAREIGLRKTLGSLKEQMIAQFISESLIYSLMAMVLALVATWFLLPGFNTLSGKELGFSAVMDPNFVAGIVALVVLVGIGAGSYPAFYLTSFNVVEVLKGKVSAGSKSKGIRRGMVIFQFGISIFLIISTVVVYNQLHFMQERDPGIDKHNVLYINQIDRLGTNRDVFRNKIAERSDVSAVSFSSNSFPGINNTTIFKAVGTDQDHIMGLFQADYDQQKVIRFRLVKGRYFSPEFPSDSMSIVLNETAAKEFGWADPINEQIRFAGDGKEKLLKVIGVFKDFNFETLKNKVNPLAIMWQRSNYILSIRYTGDSKELIAGIEEQWKKFATGEPLQYHFLDQDYDAMFRAEQRLSKIMTIFCGLAIFIACLGLFALAAFTAEQRTKEIGIRKSMGATVGSLTMMMSKEFVFLVLIAFLIFCIPTWWITKWWLESFAYRIAISPYIFILSGLSAVMVAWLTVGYQSLKAAAADPVKSLRYE